MSGRQDSNLRLPNPKSGALAKLSYVLYVVLCARELASEAVTFAGPVTTTACTSGICSCSCSVQRQSVGRQRTAAHLVVESGGSGEITKEGVSMRSQLAPSQRERLLTAPCRGTSVCIGYVMENMMDASGLRCNRILRGVEFRPHQSYLRACSSVVPL